MKKYKVAIVGATGAVGREMLRCVIQYHFPYESIKLLASSRSAGKTVEQDGLSFVVEELSIAASTFSPTSLPIFSLVLESIVGILFLAASTALVSFSEVLILILFFSLLPVEACCAPCVMPSLVAR